MTPAMRQVIDALTGKRFPLEDEKATQAAMDAAFAEAWRDILCAPTWRREVNLGGGSIIDFLIEGGVGVEVKIKGQPSAIARQLRRYAACPQIESLILVTSRPVFVAHLSSIGKPFTTFDLSRAWL